jgi:shikimate kinase / 3-dehydroquinate synthase
MDVVLVGLPGSGKSVVGKRLAARHGATFIDLDETIERAAGRSIPQIFADDGEAAFRVREREAVEALGPPDPAAGVRRVISTGGGAVIDPRNRWRLYRGRFAVWLDSRPEVLAQRLRYSAHVRPLVTGPDPIGTLRGLAQGRHRFYAAAHQVGGVAQVREVVGHVEHLLDRPADRSPETRIGEGSVLLRSETQIASVVIGEDIAAREVVAALQALGARRAIFVSEDGAWHAVGPRLTRGVADAGWPVQRLLLPQGEDAKRMSVVEEAARQLAVLRVERGEPIVAVGGGALGDAAGFLAAIYLRGIPFIQVPTTLVAQIDSSIGGKTGVDIPEGKNLLGAFHQPAAIVIDVALLRSLPERHLRAALGEAVKMAALGDERLFELLERDGEAIARGDDGAFEGGAMAELVERSAWAKVEVVTADEREEAGRITLNLGHSLGHAFEAAAGFRDLLHGEAVAFGLRAACRIGREMGITPGGRASRIEDLLTRLELGTGPLPYPLASVMGALGADKKHRDGQLRWVLPTEAGVEVRADVPGDLVERVAREILAGLPAAGAPLPRAVGARTEALP